MQSLVWVDLPVREMERAARFYQGVLGVELRIQSEAPPARVFEHAPGQPAACLIQHPQLQPNRHGPLVYFASRAKLSDCELWVPKLGGELLSPILQMGPWGYKLLVLDSEGNRIGLYHPKGD